MPLVDKDKLDELLERAGANEEFAAAFRKANDPENADAPRGHGAASPNLDTIEL